MGNSLLGQMQIDDAIKIFEQGEEKTNESSNYKSSVKPKLEEIA